jgi:hypothetical protein
MPQAKAKIYANTKYNTFKKEPWPLQGEDGHINTREPGTGRALFKKLGF